MYRGKLEDSWALAYAYAVWEYIHVETLTPPPQSVCVRMYEMSKSLNLLVSQELYVQELYGS